ncbi:MAG TPA: DUF1501 domain-containing protein [Planctomycetaceae bacterium]|nr:DUF1501 domain-containing protein [Planctomycetaceae bacterium]
MLSICGRSIRHCDGLSRRTFLAAGALGFGGLTLADLLRAEAAAGVRNSRRAVINIHLDGGPPQMDTIDPKPSAPVEIRGEFEPIATTLPGVHVCELMPKLASIAERFAFLRTVVGSDGRHHAFQCQSGWPEKDLASIGGRPVLGSVVAKLFGTTSDVAPPFVDLMQGRALVRNSARPGFLGPAYAPFRPDLSEMFHRELEPGMKNELTRLGADHSISLTLDARLTVERLDERAQLLAGLDTIRRAADATGMMDAMDQFAGQAAAILTSGRFAEAMDFQREDPATIARYTPDVREEDLEHYTSEGPQAALKLLLARRLIEAGVRCVSVSLSDFDTHSKNFPRMRQLLPIVDHALWALVTDLEERGLLDDVSIVAWGEFGRTPRINANGGRDHWPRVSPALLAGGGMRAGQVIGETDRTASAPVSRPISFQDVIATLYHTLGVDLGATTIADTHGRPQFLVEQGTVIRELA